MFVKTIAGKRAGASQETRLHFARATVNNDVIKRAIDSPFAITEDVVSVRFF